MQAEEACMREMHWIEWDTAADGGVIFAVLSWCERQQVYSARSNYVSNVTTICVGSFMAYTACIIKKADLRERMYLMIKENSIA